MEFPSVQTDGGLDAIIYTTQGGGSQPIHGAYLYDGSGGWLVTAWDARGRRTKLGVSALDITKAINEGKIKTS